MTREQANKLMDLIHDLREADTDLNDVAYHAVNDGAADFYEKQVDARQNDLVNFVETLIGE
ncbi:helicase loader [Shigella phage vb_GEC_SH_GT]|nr:helicase loader [Shigella phage vb_GEC_SH_GT]